MMIPRNVEKKAGRTADVKNPAWGFMPFYKSVMSPGYGRVLRARFIIISKTHVVIRFERIQTMQCFSFGRILNVNQTTMPTSTND
jgi:hypothetical protein